MFYCTLLVLVVCRQAAESCPEDCFLPPVQGRTEGRGHDQTGRPGQLPYLFVIFFTFLFLNYIAMGRGVGWLRGSFALSFFPFLNGGGGGSWGGGGGGGLRGLVALFVTIFFSFYLFKNYLGVGGKWVSW